MVLVTLSNYFNHHQKPLADALYRLLGESYHFIETTGVPEFRKKLGYQEITAPYIIKYYEGARSDVDNLIAEADVVIYGEAPLSIIKARYNARKLTIRDDESRYKKPNRYLKWPIYTFKSLWLNKGYLLCASAYAPIDYMLSGMQTKKCFRWGYYTELKKYNIDKLMVQKRIQTPQGVSILWAGRLIGLKHPDSVIKVTEHLKSLGLAFTMNVIGSGELDDKLKAEAQKKGLIDKIHFLGSMTPAEVREHMEKADIFMFTSDRQEGWGAVLNESMNSGCAVVADGNIGSVPYLIDDGVNGIVYRSTNWNDLCEKVEWLVRHPSQMSQMGRNAYHTMTSLWNSEKAANNLIDLCNALLKGKDNPNLTGPCSQAPLLMRKWRGVLRTL